MNVGLWYLDRFGGTRERVRQSLEKRVREAAQVHGPCPDAAQWIEEVLDELEGLGYINDEAFATSCVIRGQRQGKSQGLIIQDLRRAGIAADLRAKVLSHAVDEQPDFELQAAQLYVRSRLIGPYRADPHAFHQKDMARLARRGFSYDIARKALEKVKN